MAKSTGVSSTIIWIIAVIALLAFIGVIYLIVKDNFVKSNEFVLAGDAIAPIGIDGNSPSTLTSCSAEHDRGCESNFGAKCRRSGFWGAQCKTWISVTNTAVCECYHAA